MCSILCWASQLLLVFFLYSLISVSFRCWCSLSMSMSVQPKLKYCHIDLRMYTHVYLCPYIPEYLLHISRIRMRIRIRTRTRIRIAPRNICITFFLCFSFLLWFCRCAISASFVCISPARPLAPGPGTALFYCRILRISKWQVLKSFINKLNQQQLARH